MKAYATSRVGRARLVRRRAQSDVGWSDMSSYSVVVIAYKRRDLIEAVLARLEHQSILPRGVVVVDNGGDLPSDVAQGTGRRVPVTIVPRPDNPGYSAAVNQLRELDEVDSADHVLVLTHDAVFDDDLAERLLRPIEAAGSSVGAAGPVLMRGSRPDTVFSSGGRLTKGGRAAHLTSLPVVTDSGVPWSAVDWIDGAIIMYRRAALDAIDWLDERYFLYFEDVDTAWRMRAEGYDTVVVADSKAFQEPGAHPTYLGIRNMTLFAQRAGIAPARNMGAVLRRVAEESVVAILARRRPPLGAAYRGWNDGRRGISGKP